MWSRDWIFEYCLDILVHFKGLSPSVTEGLRTEKNICANRQPPLSQPATLFHCYVQLPFVCSRSDDQEGGKVEDTEWNMLATIPYYS
jgi:hypothetical protein